VLRVNYVDDNVLKTLFLEGCESTLSTRGVRAMCVHAHRHLMSSSDVMHHATSNEYKGRVHLIHEGKLMKDGDLLSMHGITAHTSVHEQITIIFSRY
jgi:hypothetical protein